MVFEWLAIEVPAVVVVIVVMADPAETVRRETTQPCNDPDLSNYFDIPAVRDHAGYRIH